MGRSRRRVRLAGGRRGRRACVPWDRRRRPRPAPLLAEPREAVVDDVHAYDADAPGQPVVRHPGRRAEHDQRGVSLVTPAWAAFWARAGGAAPVGDGDGDGLVLLRDGVDESLAGTHGGDHGGGVAAGVRLHPDAEPEIEVEEAIDDLVAALVGHRLDGADVAEREDAPPCRRGGEGRSDRVRRVGTLGSDHASRGTVSGLSENEMMRFIPSLTPYSPSSGSRPVAMNFAVSPSFWMNGSASSMTRPAVTASSSLPLAPFFILRDRFR